jgi:hypothetical protein
MKNDLFYYFVKSENGDRKKEIITDHFLGDIEEAIFYEGEVWIIEDYSWEFDRELDNEVF